MCQRRPRGGALSSVRCCRAANRFHTAPGLVPLPSSPRRRQRGRGSTRHKAPGRAHTRPALHRYASVYRARVCRVVDSHTKARERAESRRVNLHPAAPWRHPLPSVCSRIGEEEDLRRRRRRSIRISSSSPRFLRTELFPLSFLFVARLEKLFPFSCFSRRTGRERNLENGRRSFYGEMHGLYDKRSSKRETYPVQEPATWRGSSLLCTSCWHL